MKSCSLKTELVLMISFFRSGESLPEGTVGVTVGYVMYESAKHQGSDGILFELKRIIYLFRAQANLPVLTSVCRYVGR